ncbi:MAG: branched-chain amino acid aminotransferase [Thermoplasmata archaeon]|jgi:branched-chain amino acid aminotransferase|nr:branched-chain amino acid aminotransferase [Thermoplasmata archaeon]
MSAGAPANPRVIMDGKLVPWEKATIHVSTHGFLYGTAVFEGVRAYWNEESRRLNVFELDAHSKRLERNAKMMGFSQTPDWKTLREWQLYALSCNEFSGDVYLRPVIYYGEGGIGIFPKTQAQKTLIMAVPMGSYFGKPTLSVKVSSWVRIPGNVIPPLAKVNGGYANSYLAAKEARDAGFDDAIMLNRNGYVSEGSGANIFVVKDGHLITPGYSNDILDGVTRTHVMRLAKDLGIPVEVRTIARAELYTADELFFCGTGVEISPIGKVDHVVLNENDVGPITKQIQARFQSSVRGKIPQYAHLLTPVPAECPIPLTPL